MTPSEMDDFARRYFDEFRQMESPIRAERLAWRDDEDRPSAVLYDLVLADGDAAEEAWPIIHGLIDRAPDEEGVDLVAAGQLEELIKFHGEQFAERIVELGRRDRRFRYALEGVWGWERVHAPLRDEVANLLGPSSAAALSGRKRRTHVPR
jgi:hypothetical protein